MNTDWYVKIDNVEHGPLIADVLKQLAQQGKVKPDTPVKKGHAGEWHRASHVKDLFSTKDGNDRPTTTTPSSNRATPPPIPKPPAPDTRTAQAPSRAGYWTYCVQNFAATRSFECIGICFGLVAIPFISLLKPVLGFRGLCFVLAGAAGLSVVSGIVHLFWCLIAYYTRLSPNRVWSVTAPLAYGGLMFLVPMAPWIIAEYFSPPHGLLATVVPYFQKDQARWFGLPVDERPRDDEAVRTGLAIPNPHSSIPPTAIAPFNETKAKEHQVAWAKYLNEPVVQTNSIGMKLVLIPPGEFKMGSNESDMAADKGEKPEHRVTITKPFYFGAYSVTLGQFRKFVVETGRGAGTNILDKNYKDWHNQFSDQTDDQPVVDICWEQATSFCDWLSKREGKTYHLPTEAEWEYACRAGTTTRYFFGDESKDLDEYAWYATNSISKTHPVGQKRPNAFGLFDLYGNVWQWCADWKSDDYSASAAVDPSGPGSGVDRVLRGGAWGDVPNVLRSANRFGARPRPPGYRRRFQGAGFRVALVPIEK